jgi:hypothetical protein
MKKTKLLLLTFLLGILKLTAQTHSIAISESQLKYYLSHSIQGLRINDLCKTSNRVYAGEDGLYPGGNLLVADPGDTDPDIPNGKTFQKYTDILRLVRNVKPKFIGDAIANWGIWDWDPYWNRNTMLVYDLKKIDPEIIVQASPNEYVTEEMARLAGTIPQWVWDAFGLPNQNRSFDIQKMKFADWATNANHRWGDARNANNLPIAIVPNISTLESALWFYYLGRRYIDIGCESLNFSQAGLMNNFNNNPSNWNVVLDRLRDYARLQDPNKIRYLLIASHGQGMRDANNRLAFDFMEGPARPSEMAPVPLVGFPGRTGPHMSIPLFPNGGVTSLKKDACPNDEIYGKTLGGINPSGWTTEKSYGMIFLDNFGLENGVDPSSYGTPHSPPINCYSPFRWDEQTWFAFNAKVFRDDWLKYAWYQVKFLDPWLFFSPPVRRDITPRSPDVTARHYYANTPSTALPPVNTIGNVSNGYVNRNVVQADAAYGQEETIKELMAGKYDVNYCPPSYYLYGFQSGTWSAENPRIMGDINGDGKADIVGFGNDGVYLSLSSGTSFATPVKVLNNYFCYNQGWRTANHLRYLADVNGDGKQDIVGFGNDGVWLALGAVNGFTTPTLVLQDFHYANSTGWLPENIRLMADANGDGKADIIGFGNQGVLVSYSTGTSFTGASYKINNELGYNQGWRVAVHPRMMGDVNGDGKADIVAFGGTSVLLSLSTGSGFTSPTYVLDNTYSFGSTSPYSYGSENPRFLADVDGDGKADIVAFGGDGTYVSFSTGTGFTQPVLGVENYGYDMGWRLPRHIRLVGDVNGDGKADIVACGENEIQTSLSIATGRSYNCIFAQRVVGPQSFGPGVAGGQWSVSNDPRYLADIDGDGRMELLGINATGVLVENCGTGANQTFMSPVVNNRLNNKETAVQVYPNPAKDKLNIIVDNGDNNVSLQYTIMNMLGNVVLQGNMGREGAVDISRLVPGNYIVAVHNKGRNIRLVRKFVIEK